mmetsp:Transcript_38780/g.99536  ORF Transcript_38780/g.99536 Transcript_38780/m.99536 type:complete len:225 (-) Transcript_38780:80-754(-)|eukprot:CAMPEP_0113869146 /NCGR_PEP_ID=MMETSP0780_2-20120614/1376_1 /TAXON_ID=652834 /ORGANISM="Palpitomonas bilix" /LENGTH=224 /DNA_ID=CAMNT_0000854295 /DNA_START=96 /DNA_END=770 /DNA_ORIENTATION=- /assembly_acc=CAM_ASM_000599
MANFLKRAKQNILEKVGHAKKTEDSVEISSILNRFKESSKVLDTLSSSLKDYAHAQKAYVEALDKTGSAMGDWAMTIRDDNPVKGGLRDYQQRTKSLATFSGEHSLSLHQLQEKFKVTTNMLNRNMKIAIEVYKKHRVGYDTEVNNVASLEKSSKTSAVKLEEAKKKLALADQIFREAETALLAEAAKYEKEKNEAVQEVLGVLSKKDTEFFKQAQHTFKALTV